MRPESACMLSYNPLMAISLTPAALARVREFLERTPDALGLRLGVKKTGCSGWGYEVDLARQQHADDSISEQDGVRIYVDAMSQPLVDGTQITKAQPKRIGGTLKKLAHARQGCGESFTVDEAHRAL